LLTESSEAPTTAQRVVRNRLCPDEAMLKMFIMNSFFTLKT
jgi:hypothetical protein